MLRVLGRGCCPRKPELYRRVAGREGLKLEKGQQWYWDRSIWLEVLSIFPGGEVWRCWMGSRGKESRKQELPTKMGDPPGQKSGKKQRCLMEFEDSGRIEGDWMPGTEGPS